MWCDSMTRLSQHTPCILAKRRFGLYGLLLTLALTVNAHASDLPRLCSVDNTQGPDQPAVSSSSAPTDNPTEPTDCYEFGASVGEMGWDWRKKLPGHVRWVKRKDAPELCAQVQTVFGQKVDSPVPSGCVFLAPAACTIVTSGPISPASIGNAVRDCVP